MNTKYDYEWITRDIFDSIIIIMFDNNENFVIIEFKVEETSKQEIGQQNDQEEFLFSNCNKILHCPFLCEIKEIKYDFPNELSFLYPFYL